MGEPTAAAQAFLSQVVGREVLRTVAPLLRSAGVPVMPLKGVWLQACAYPASQPRRTTDVDVLVPEARYPRALEILESAGWRKQPGNVSEAALDHPAFPLPLDLHRRLFTRRAFRLHTHLLFARARTDRDVFGVEVQLPDPMDAFAHLVGHFVKSRTPLDDPMRLSDFVAVARQFALEPAACALRLHEVGMARAARFALAELAGRDPAGFFQALLEALPSDPVGERAVAIARFIAARDRLSSTLGALPGFILDRSLAAGGIALALRFIDRGSEGRIE